MSLLKFERLRELYTLTMRINTGYCTGNMWWETKLKRGQLHETLYLPDLLFPDSFYYPSEFPLRIIEPYFGEGYIEVKYNDWIK